MRPLGRETGPAVESDPRLFAGPCRSCGTDLTVCLGRVRAVVATLSTRELTDVVYRLAASRAIDEALCCPSCSHQERDQETHEKGII